MERHDPGLAIGKGGGTIRKLSKFLVLGVEGRIGWKVIGAVENMSGRRMSLMLWVFGNRMSGN